MPAKQQNESKKKAPAKKGAERFDTVAFVNTTPEGQLKDFSQPMAATYSPAEVEAAWDTYWEKRGFYAPDVESDKEPFVMVMPPPNVTGTLHLGHALTVAVEDAVVRWNRMHGKNVLWVPGTDHAGIATQVVVEKKLMREEKKTRHDIGREAFLEEVWKWKGVNGSRICEQLRRMGASTDWSRERFTMDDQCNLAVREAFVTMADKGLIYRDNRLVNWSCTLNTAISSIEVDHVDFEGPTMVSVPGYETQVEVGVMHSFAYKVKGSETDEELVVATTRIETMLGDVAVAVHPDDERYTHLHGKELVHPFLPERTVLVVTDGKSADMTLGTGAVKITPAHDPKDYECGVRNNLPQISIFTNDGTMNEHCAQFTGQPRFVARTTVIEELEKLGLYRGKTPNPMSIGFCSRSKDIIEPILRPQWYVRCTELGQKAMDVVANDELEILPAFHKSTWNNFLTNDEPWCISRQLWWGHRIPAYLVVVDGVRADDSDGNNFVVGRTDEEAMERAKAKFPDATNITLEQDPDVLDTWFSSGLFPFSVMGWPNKTPDLDKFFPGQLLETGHDILFFWVAKMVMMSLALTDKLPFSKVYLHAMVRDRQGKKMSKSKGNVLDPIDVMEGITLQALHAKLESNTNLDPKEIKRALQGQKKEFPNGIAQCGTDALRLGLLTYTTQGRDINLNIDNVVSQREFCNKLWNATRFALLNFTGEFKKLDSVTDVLAAVNQSGGRVTHKWILSKLGHVVKAYNKHFTEYQFGNACIAVREFWLSELCAVYLEVSKPIFRSEDEAEKLVAMQVLYLCLDYGLRLLHPLMPFVTEELFHRLPGYVSGTSIVVAAFPTDAEADLIIDAETDEVMELVQAIGATSRSMRAGMNLTRTKLHLHVMCGDQKTFERLAPVGQDLQTIAHGESVTVLAPGTEEPVGCVRNFISDGLDLFSDVRGLRELGAEVLKREKKAAGLLSSVQGLQLSIGRPGFAKAKPEQQEKMRASLASNEQDLKVMEDSIANFLSLMDESQIADYKLAKIASVEKDIAKAAGNLAKTEKKLAKAPDNKKSLAAKVEQEATLAGLTAALAALKV